MTKFIVILAVILFTLGCDDSPPPWTQGSTGHGYVRNVWHRGVGDWEGPKGCFDVTFEREDGVTVVYDFANLPPVWQGMHANIAYADYGVPRWGCRYVAGPVQRLP